MGEGTGGALPAARAVGAAVGPRHAEEPAAAGGAAEGGAAEGGAGGSAGSSSGGSAGELIVIHVCDDNRRINRDYCCGRELLLAHMCYFQEYLCGETGYDDIDISVHCTCVPAHRPSPFLFTLLLAPPPHPHPRSRATSILPPPALARCTSSSG